MRNPARDLEPGELEPRELGDGVATLVAVAAGLVAVVGVLAGMGISAPFVVVVWSLMIVGLVLALGSDRARPVGVGLLVAGAAIPVAATVWLWIAVSGGVLLG
jgi:hypothetical protein